MALRETGKKLTALLLSIAMVLSMTLETLPAAHAAGESVSAPTVNGDFGNSTLTRRPGLYVDFLGDNRKYVAPGAAENPGGLSAPGAEDQSKTYNDNGTNTWEGYHDGETHTDGSLYDGNTIFWIGVGIDRMNVLDLFKQDDRGIYSLELGFYYNSDYVEPYTGSGDYKAVIEQSNLGNFAHTWGNNYQIIAAETDLKPQTDLVTQETIAGPNINEILTTDSWKMTYVSLERKAEAGASRFAGIYRDENDGMLADGTQDPAKKDDGTRYILLIPFRLKQYDPNHKTQFCLRLVRNAGLFSMGGGADGTEPYGAWERVTTRNPGHELKLMTNFMGDLDIFFEGERRPDPLYRADLQVIDGGGTDNNAKLSVTGDPSVNPVWVDKNSAQPTITNLASGTGMTVDVSIESGYAVKSFKVYYDLPDSTRVYIEDDPNALIPLNPNQSQYTFLMPDHNVIVEVTFEPADIQEFQLFLDDDEDRDGEKPVTAGGKVTGNGTVLEATHESDPAVVVDKDSPRDNSRKLPAERVKVIQGEKTKLEVHVDLHGDYCAQVEIYNVAGKANLAPTTLAAGATVGTGNVITMTQSGTIERSELPRSDVIVRVRYYLATRYTATLEVWRDGSIPAPVDGNVAQMRTDAYTDDNQVLPAYTGVVYERDESGTLNHSAVKNDFKVLEEIDLSSAVMSGSLGGDGRTPVGWSDSKDSLMAVLAGATSAAYIKDKVTALDIRKQDVRGTDPKVLGLRKNAMGDFYTDSDIGTGTAAGPLCRTLWELAQLAAADPTLKKDKLDTDGTTVLYSYYDLTPAQVQMYLLDYAQYELDLADAIADGTTPLPTAPGLRTVANADNALAGYTWYDPTDPTNPKTRPELVATPPKASLETRAGREMAVVLESSSVYTVADSVRVLKADGSRALITTVNLRPDPEHKNVYLFEMPAENCIVEVTYRQRKIHELKLEIKYVNDTTPTDPANQVKVTAYGPDSTTPAAKQVFLTKDQDQEVVLVDSTVTVKVNKATDYRVSMEVFKSNNDIVTTVPGTTTNLNDGEVVRFQMPDDTGATPTRIVITYTKQVDTHNANIVTQYYRNQDIPDGSAGTNSAVWQGTTLTVLSGVPEGRALVAEATVIPGYYIYSAEAYTANGSYPFTMDGNGWNNGQGGLVTLNTVMPDAEYYVRFTFRKGPPPKELEQALTLQADDPDNTAAPYADNWAGAATGSVTFQKVGVGTTGGGILADTQYVKAGERVQVEFHPDTGYHVESVTVEPAALGVNVVWTGTTTAEFIMPAGSASVVVRFEKGSYSKRLVLDLDKTETGGTASGANTVMSVASGTLEAALGAGNVYDVGENALPQTVPGTTMTTSVAVPGETVTLNLQTAQGWYIHSLTVTGANGQLPYTLSDNGYNATGKGTAVATFVMPNSDASVVVHYRMGPPPAEETDHVMTLVVSDPENKKAGTPEEYGDNHASALISGADPDRTVGPLGLALNENVLRGSEYAKAGEKVTIDYHADTGYALDIIIVTAAGWQIPVRQLAVSYMGGGRAEFIMPNENVTALVRFKAGEERKYTANLVLQMPNGTPISDYDKVGRGSFGTDPEGGVYSRFGTPGESIDFAALARDGYYIERVTITPAVLGVEAQVSGSFKQQAGSFVMPAADVQVNIWFARLWPDEVKYDLRLEVYDPSGGDSAANFKSIGGADLAAPDNEEVGPKRANQSKLLTQAAFDDDTVVVALAPAAERYVKSVTVTDSRGKSVPWRYVPGGIGFEMPPAHVTVVVQYAQRTDTEHEAQNDVTLHIDTGAMGGASLTGLSAAAAGTRAALAATSITVSADGDVIHNVPAGSTLTLVANPNAGNSIIKAYAVGQSGVQLLLPMTLVTAGGTATFAMPEENADVYVVFLDSVPETGELPGTLVVAGPAGSGSAQMTAAAGSRQDTGVVAAAGAGTVFAPRGTKLTVKLTVEDGYNIAAIRVTDGLGTPVEYTWTNGDQREFTLEMPAAEGARVYVEYEKIEDRDDLTAQVVVNNGGNALNTALLRPKGGVAPGTARLTGLHPNDALELDLVVQPGYRIEYIKVVPAKLGIQPSLTGADTASQTTGLTMPGEDIVVYVKFVQDTRDRNTATLHVLGANVVGVAGNQGWIESDVSGSQGPVVPHNNTASVQAAPAAGGLPAEWVTVDYEWAEDYDVVSIRVVDARGNNVLYTQSENPATRKGQLTFPMANSNVEVYIEFDKPDEPVKYDAILHVIDMDTATEITDVSWGQLTWGTDSTGQITAKPAPGGTATLRVPAGEKVRVDAETVSPGVYLWAGYVLHRDNGQMIRFEFKPDDAPAVGFSGHKDAEFTMHSGTCHVYLYFTKTVPEQTDYAAVLILDSPAGDTKSTASITATDPAGTVQDTDTVTANQTDPDHGYIVSTQGDTVTVSVTPADGYVIDYIKMTPLGTTFDEGGTVVPTRSGNTYTFEMPAKNVAVYVKLRASSLSGHRLTLHYRMAEMQDGDYVKTDPDTDWASLTFTDSSGGVVSWKDDGGYRMVDQGTRVTLGVSMDSPRLVLAAYVLRANGDMVELTPGLEKTKEGNSLHNDDLTDAEATFTMPADATDAFVWFTETEPTTEWHTAVLTATDEKGTVINSGDNTARIRTSKSHTETDGHTAKSFGVMDMDGIPAHVFLWVEKGETVTVWVDRGKGDIAAGYDFDSPATITPSGSVNTPTLTEDNVNYIYTYTVGDYNAAVNAHFVAANTTQHNLRVVAKDRDNPGNGPRNVVEVQPGRMTPLTVRSTTSAGARQTVPGVTTGTQISFTVRPDIGFRATARLLKSDGTLLQNLTLTANGDGSYSGQMFLMPDEDATLEVTFYKSRKVTLTVRDTRGETTDVNTSTGQMTESGFGGIITDDTSDSVGTSFADGLPDGTLLSASITDLAAGTHLIGALLNTGSGAYWMSATTVDGKTEYQHTISGTDVEITLVVGPDSSNDLIASVSAVNLPGGTAAPTIEASPVRAPHGDSWTMARTGDRITVTVQVPEGYEAQLTTNDGTVLSETKMDGSDAAITDGTATFTMPNNNVHVTVTYKKTRFTATIVASGNGTAAWDAPLTNPVVTGLKGGEVLNFTAVPNDGSKLKAVIGSGSIGYINYPTVKSVTMPKEDIVVTAIFSTPPTNTRYLDLHVSGTAGGTATLVATRADGSTVGSLSSSPTSPVGFSRIYGATAGELVTLTAAPGSNYIVTVGYYLHNGAALTYETFNIDGTNGGTATFRMPDTNTCMYVNFRTRENPPKVDPDRPDNPDPNHYLDLHVSGTGGGSAELTAAGVGTVSSTPTNPHSVSTLRPVGTGTDITLTVTPAAGYTAMVSYYVYYDGVPRAVDLPGVPGTGDTVNFTMPSQSTCVYVTFRGPDRLPYLDLHVTNPAGGRAVLSTDGFGTLSSTPAAPQSFGRIDQVEAGTPVTLDVTPGADYTVTVSYYRHDGANLIYETYTIDGDYGGMAAFDMPNTNTCIYVTFHGPGDDPDPDPAAKYLDLHVSGTRGGTAILETTVDGTPPTPATMSSTPTAPNSYSSVRPVAEGTVSTLTVKAEPGYTVSLSSYVHGSGGTLTYTETTDVTDPGWDGVTRTYTFAMPATSACVYVTFKPEEDPDPDRHYLDLHVSGAEGGSAVLAATGVGSLSSTPAAPMEGLQRLEPVPGGTAVTLDVGPLTNGYTVTVSYYVHNGGTLTYDSYVMDASTGGRAEFKMPEYSTCIYVTFQKAGDPPVDPDPPDPPEPPDNTPHIAFVVVEGRTDGLPLNKADDIVDTTNTTLGGGTLWAYGNTNDDMLVTFTVAPLYTAVVTAEYADGSGTKVTVGQQGTTGAATATLTMPDADVKVTITYYGPDDPIPDVNERNLTLRLVGHGGEAGNFATLTGGNAPLSISGAANPSGAPVSTSATKAVLGAALDLDANRLNNYKFLKATLEYTDAGGVRTELVLNLNEYGTNGASLLFMPDADAVVTVYYSRPYEATLFVIDKDGNDFRGDTDSANDPAANGVVPKSTLAVQEKNGTDVPGSPTTKTHTPITDLYGDEIVKTNVDLTTLPPKTSVASVVAYSPSSGTIHLKETVMGSGVYEDYPMSTATRPVDDVDVTVILRDDDDPNRLYTATVYKVGHDNQPGNSATITNTKTAGLPAGNIWAGAYETDRLRVDVSTAAGYYAVVTAVNVSTGAAVPVLQWTATGPFDAQFDMPAADVDVTVTYRKDPPEAPLTLILEGHGQKLGNKADVNDKTAGTPIPTLQLNGSMAANANPLSKDSDAPVKAGTQLEILGGHDGNYYIESITVEIPGFTIPLAVTTTDTAETPMPVVAPPSKAIIRVKFTEGKKSPRPFDPEHSTIYYAPPTGNYPTGDDGDNPDLSTDPKGEEGWLLAENLSETAPETLVVTIPALYDKPDPDKQDTLYDAGVGGTLTTLPTYTFYWKDDLGVFHPLVEGTDITSSDIKSLDPNENPKGNYPAGSIHYGYQVTIKSLITNSALSTYLEEGGTIYVTAKYAGTTATGAPWAESAKTQVVIQPAVNFTATLRVVDVSSSQNNKVTLWVDGDTGYAKFGSITQDTQYTDKIEHLVGKETLKTEVAPDAQVQVVSVMAIPKTESPSPVYLSPEVLTGGYPYIGTDTYPYDMIKDDVEIVVVLSNEGEKLHTATVVKVDPDEKPENTVAISNPTHPVLDRDTNTPARWTAAYTGDEIRVDVTAGEEYLVTVEAIGKETGTVLGVSQSVGGGPMVVTLTDKMPDENVEIKVTFTKIDKTLDQSWVTLRMRMADGSLPLDPRNSAEAVSGGTAVLDALAASGYTDTRLFTSLPLSLTVNTTLAPQGYDIQSVEWSIDGVPQTPLGSGASVPVTITGTGALSQVVITVILKETKVDGRTPRPFDPAHSTDYLDAADHIDHDDVHTGHTGPDGHQNGYLRARNLGGSQVRITVPNLYDGDLYPAKDVIYKLYAKIGGQMVLLEPRVDYDVVVPTQTLTTPHHANGKDWNGQVFTIQCLNPTGALGDYVKNGGVIYITATDVVTPGTESAFTEVILPADTIKNYTATLEIVDDTTEQNRAAMENANSGATVSWDALGPVNATTAGTIPGLVGGELIRTQVDPAPGVIYTVMAHTDTRGDVLLFPDPTLTNRYPKDMPSENMTVTVHFHDEDDPDHIHIAAVEKQGATAVAGNDADITDITDKTTPGLRTGDIWTEGHDDDKIQVHVTTAPGYYATVTMSYLDATNTLVTHTLITQGVGNGTDIDVEFDMPHADVQVVVFFEAGQKSPRPFDPNHSERHVDPADTDPYKHNGSEDQSTTHEDGWLLGENLGDGTADVTIPTLWIEDALENATEAGFTFYLKDATTGNYIKLTEGTDYTLTHPDTKAVITTSAGFKTVKNTYTYLSDPADTTSSVTKEYTGVRFILNEVKDGKLEGKIANGLSLYVTATKESPSVLPWLESDMTELVIPSSGLRPFDPNRENPEGTDPIIYEDHWIRAENRGDYLIVTVPMLNSPQEDDPTEVDGDVHRFQLHLQKDGEDWKDDISGIVNVTNLLKISNVKGYDHPVSANTLYDPTWALGTPPNYLYEEFYENEVYYTDPGTDGILGDPDDPTDPNGADDTAYHGARFIVEIMSDEEINANDDITDKTKAKANAKILRGIFDNEGTMGDHSYRMYITSDKTTAVDDALPTFRNIDYVDFEVPQYYTLTGILESYAPKHTATFSLYPRVTPGTDPAPEPDEGPGQNIGANDVYETDPAFMYRQFRDKGSGLWQLDFDIKSSELMGDDRKGVTYQLVIEKAGHVTFTWRVLELSPDTLDVDGGLVFTLAAWDETGAVDTSAEGVIALFGGDVNNDGYVQVDDWSMMMRFIDGTWSQDDVNDPKSLEYKADLDGDGEVWAPDTAIWNSDRNYNKKARDYARPELRRTAKPINVVALDLLMEELVGLPPEELPVEGELPPEEIPPEDQQPPEEERTPETGETPQEPGEGEDGAETPPEEDKKPGDGTDPEPGGGEDLPGEEPKEPGATEPGQEPDPEEPETPQNPEEPEEPKKPEESGEPDVPGDPEGGEPLPDEGQEPPQPDEPEGGGAEEPPLPDEDGGQVEIIPEDKETSVEESMEKTGFSEDIG